MSYSWLEIQDWFMALRYELLQWIEYITFVVVVVVLVAANYAYWAKKHSGRGAAAGMIASIFFLAFCYYHDYNLIVSGFILPFVLVAVVWVALAAVLRLPGFVAGYVLFVAISIWLWLDIQFFCWYMWAWIDLW